MGKMVERNPSSLKSSPGSGPREEEAGLDLKTRLTALACCSLAGTSHQQDDMGAAVSVGEEKRQVEPILGQSGWVMQIRKLLR